MLGSTLYLVGRDAKTGGVIPAASCSLCRRFILNAGIEKIVSRLSEGEYEVIFASDWIENDDSLPEFASL